MHRLEEKPDNVGIGEVARVARGLRVRQGHAGRLPWSTNLRSSPLARMVARP